jgi:hypothetical protein
VWISKYLEIKWFPDPAGTGSGQPDQKVQKSSAGWERVFLANRVEAGTSQLERRELHIQQQPVGYLFQRGAQRRRVEALGDLDGRDNRHWRYVPPSRYSLDFGYRSGYELAWRDWLNHGRHDRHWRRSSFYGFGVGYTYHSGYEAGWRDAAYYYGRGYRPDYWAYDPHGGWYFSFRIAG